VCSLSLTVLIVFLPLFFLLTSSSQCLPVSRLLVFIPFPSPTCIAWVTLENALSSTMYTIRRRHAAFKLTFDDRQRLRAVFPELQDAGKITSDPARDPQWVSSKMVSHFSRSLLIDAIRHGTSCLEHRDSKMLRPGNSGCMCQSRWRRHG
jgi:hypothetical protein